MSVQSGISRVSNSLWECPIRCRALVHPNPFYGARPSGLCRARSSETHNRAKMSESCRVDRLDRSWTNPRAGIVGFSKLRLNFPESANLRPGIAGIIFPAPKFRRNRFSGAEIRSNPWNQPIRSLEPGILPRLIFERRIYPIVARVANPGLFLDRDAE